MGRDILQAGGSAVDAAVTSTLCLAVASPQSSGLGGGLFMVIYTAEGGTADAIAAIETAPEASAFDMFVNDTEEANYGARAVAVPSELAGLWEAHQRFGALPWDRLLAPVIRMATDGYPLAWHTEYCLKILRKNFDRWPILRDLYTKEDGSLVEEGEIVTSPPGMISTLQAISDQGATAFFGGEVGQKLVQDIQDQGGVMTLADLETYSVISQPALTLSLNSSRHRVFSSQLTSSGHLLQFTVNVMDECNMRSVDFGSYEGRLRLYHYFIEASTFAIGLRLHIGDADTPEVRKATEALSSRDYARTICSKINPAHVTHPYGSRYDTFDDLPAAADSSEGRSRRSPAANLKEEKEEEKEEEEEGDRMHGDTSHLSVYAENGDAVSLTTSVGRYFGSRTFSNQTGFFLNGHMGNMYYDGRTPAWPANRLTPGAHVMSTMSPSILTNPDGSVHSVVGSSGGMRIISTNAWVILRSLWGTEALSEMIDAPRVYAYRSTTVGRTYYEKDFPEDLLAGLRDMGHTMQETSSFAAAQGILREPGVGVYAHSDPRKRGYPAGY